MLADDVFGIATVRTLGISALEFLLGQIQNDGNAMNILLPGEFNDLLAGIRLDIRSIDNCSLHQIKALVCCIEQKVKSLAGYLLVSLIVRNHATEEVR